MGDGTKTALAVSLAAGYLLGRGRKAKLAVALGAYLASGGSAPSRINSLPPVPRR